MKKIDEKKIYMFSAPWCENCKVAVNVAKENKIDYEYVNVDENQELAAEFGIMSIPSIIDNRSGEKIPYLAAGRTMQFIHENKVE